MTNIVLPEEKDEEIKITYKATEKDEEVFFLMYHLNFQPSEALALEDDYRQWLVARFMAQKNMEREAMQRHQLMNQIGPDLKGGFRVDG